MRLGMGLAAAAAVLLAVPPAQGQPAGAACQKDRATTVCTAGKRALRVIQGSQSPSGRYAVAWAPRESRRRSAKTTTDDRGVVTLIQERADNVLLRLADGKVLARLAGDHFSDGASFLSTDHFSHWSPDNAYLVEVNNGRWSTKFADAYHVGKGDRVSRGFDLLPVCKTALLGHYKELRGSKRDYQTFVAVKSVAADGTVALACTMAVSRTEEHDRALEVRLRLQPARNALRAERLSAEQPAKR